MGPSAHLPGPHCMERCGSTVLGFCRVTGRVYLQMSNPIPCERLSGLAEKRPGVQSALERARASF